MISKTLEKELNLANWQVERVIRLIDDGNTIPFIARYRKDVTGSLNDETLREFDERLKYLRNLEEKKEKVIRRIEELGKLTPELAQEILDAKTLAEELLNKPLSSQYPDGYLFVTMGAGDNWKLGKTDQSIQSKR